MRTVNTKPNKYWSSKQHIDRDKIHVSRHNTIFCVRNYLFLVGLGHGETVIIIKYLPNCIQDMNRCKNVSIFFALTGFLLAKCIRASQAVSYSSIRSYNSFLIMHACMYIRN